MLPSRVHPEALRAEVNEAIKKQVDGDTESAFSIVYELSDHYNLNLLLSQVLRDESWLSEAAQRSYYHTNNFAKIVLLVGRDADWKLRLHLWWPQAEPVREKLEDIHSHRWDFTTSLIVGDYAAMEYRPGAGVKHYRYEYRAAGQAGTFTLAPRGEAMLTRVFHARLSAGTVYHISHDVLHRISNNRPQLTASLMIQGPALCNATEVYSTSQLTGHSETQIPVERIDPSTLRDELSRFREYI